MNEKQTKYECTGPFFSAVFVTKYQQIAFFCNARPTSLKLAHISNKSGFLNASRYEREETFKSTFFCWWINRRLCWNILYAFFMSEKKTLNKALKLFITIVVKQTLLTIQSRWKAIEEVSVFYSVHIWQDHLDYLK